MIYSLTSILNIHDDHKLLIRVFRDAISAFNWLADVFGFKKTAEVLGPDGQILHAEMSFGASTIMLGEASEEELEQSPFGIGSSRPR